MTTITLRIDDDLLERLKTYCKDNDRSMSNTLRYALKHFLEAQEEAQ